MKSLRIVRKSVSTSKACRPLDPGAGLCIKTGQRPEKDVQKDGHNELRPWQKKAFLKLRNAEQGILISPTGSGKSAVQKGLAYLSALSGRKALIMVPESSIGHGFDTDKGSQTENGYKPAPSWALPGKIVMKWEVAQQNFLIGPNFPEQSKIDALIRFLKNKPSKNSVSERIMVCTHQAAVLAFQQMGQKSWWKGTDIYVDEAHHIKFNEAGEEEEMDEVLINRLGCLIRHYVENRPGKVLVSTATWLRGDAASIIPAQYRKNFENYTLSIDEFLSLISIQNILFRFVAADTYEQGFAQLVKEDPNKKTLVYLPPVKDQAGVRQKSVYLKEFKRVLGKAKSEGFVDTHIHANGEQYRSLDLVNNKGRADRQKDFNNSKGTIFEPDYIFVQSLFREGADWQAAQRSIVMGSRGCLPMLIQMLGRLLRKHPGKDYVEFCMLLPSTMITDLEQYMLYSRTVFTVMALGWQFTVSLSDQVQQNALNKLRQAEVLQGIIEDLPKVMLSDDERDAIDIASEVIENNYAKAQEAAGLDGTLTKGETKKAAVSLLSCLGQTFRAAMRAVKGQMSKKDYEATLKKIEQDPIKGGRAMFRQTIADFGAIQEQYSDLPTSLEYVRQRMFLDTCLNLLKQGKKLNPRKLDGAVELFGSKAKLDQACEKWGI